MTDTIGQQLKHAREAKNLTIQKVVQVTHIRAHSIEAMEADNFESLPSPVQARAFLKLYAEFLGLSLDEIITRQRNGTEPIPETPSSPEPVAGPAADERAHVTDVQRPVLIQRSLNLFQRVRERFTRLEDIQPGQLPVLEQNEEEEESHVEEVGDADSTSLEAPATEFYPSAPEILQSQSIFLSIGSQLRQRRENLGLTLEEIERQTHVRRHYLQALEAGNYGNLPSSVQARGMLSNYAHFLDLDVETLLLTFAEGLQAQRVERQPKPEEPIRPVTARFTIKNIFAKVKLPASITRYLTMDVIVGVGLVLVLLFFAMWGTSRIINLRSSSTPESTAPSIVDVLLSTSIAINGTPTIMSAAGTLPSNLPPAGEMPVITAPASGNGPVQVVVIAKEQAWVRVTVDGKIEFEGRSIPGTAYPFDGNNQIEVLTGNGLALNILYNQNDLGPMGNFGEVVDRIYTATTILNPTATFTPSPTITSTPTVTLRPSTTPRPSRTPRNTPTP